MNQSLKAKIKIEKIKNKYINLDNLIKLLC